LYILYCKSKVLKRKSCFPLQLPDFSLSVSVYKNPNNACSETIYQSFFFLIKGIHLALLESLTRIQMIRMLGLPAYKFCTLSIELALLNMDAGAYMWLTMQIFNQFNLCCSMILRCLCLITYVCTQTLSKGC
jgi:hypothetical protein